MDADSLARIHRFARDRGASRPVYALARALLIPLLRFWFRLRIEGAENIPAEGAAIVAPNHKSFLDAFFVGVATKRQVRFMAKVELFTGPLRWLFPRLGAFPVRRGESDTEALDTARAILHQGGLLVIFPEGTRVEEVDALGAPRHGAERLAGETGSPIVPAAIAGSSRLWLGPIPKPKRVLVSFLPPVRVPDLDQVVWPAVREEYGRLVATPSVIATALAAVGLGGFAARKQLGAVAPRVLGVVEPRKLRRKRARRRATKRVRSLARRR